MTVVLVLLVLQGLIGAFDTFYFHEWRARLPALGLPGGHWPWPRQFDVGADAQA